MHPGLLGFSVQYRKGANWSEYRLCQQFGSITDLTRAEILKFVTDEMPHRALGNACILLCGETNGVKYSKATKSVEDPFGLRRSIPKNVNVVLNPIHDRMTRFEMKLKRRFLSMGRRWTISVWNKGRKDKNGRTRDGKEPAWTIFRSGKSMESSVKMIEGPSGFEIGVIDVSQ